MKRLIDDPDLSLAEARLAELVQSSERFEPDSALKRSVRARLRAPSPAGSRLRGPTLAVALLCVGTAGAAVGYDWVDSSPRSQVTEHVVVQLPQPSPVPRSKPPQKPQTTSEDPPAPRLEERTANPAPAGERRGRTAPEKVRRTGEDPAPVIDAIRALRKSRDPARAQRLLDDYLKSNPRGALREDALGLAIEAAAARGDPRAADYARRYLARFPNGRFRSMAVRAAQR
jgi:hypothetical protein